MRAVFVVLLVDCRENVVNLAWVLWSWTYYIETMGVCWTWWVESTDITGFLDSAGLNINKLSALRKKAIEPFLDENLSEREFSQFVSGYLRKNTSKMFGEFWTTIDYIFVQKVQNKES